MGYYLAMTRANFPREQPDPQIPDALLIAAGLVPFLTMRSRTK